MGRRRSNGPDWVGVWAMERRRDTWRPWAERTRKEPAPRGPTLSCLFPPPTFSHSSLRISSFSLLRSKLLLFSCVLFVEAPPLFKAPPQGEFAFNIFGGLCSRYPLPYSLFSILLDLIYILLFSMLSFTLSPLWFFFFSILLSIEWVQSGVRVLGCVFLSKCMHFSHFRSLLLFWSVSVEVWVCALCRFLFVLDCVAFSLY